MPQVTRLEWQEMERKRSRPTTSLRGGRQIQRCRSSGAAQQERFMRRVKNHDAYGFVRSESLPDGLPVLQGDNNDRVDWVDMTQVSATSQSHRVIERSDGLGLFVQLLGHTLE